MGILIPTPNQATYGKAFLEAFFLLYFVHTNVYKYSCLYRVPIWLMC